MKKLSKNENGFAAFEPLVFIVVAIILIGAAYYVGKHSNNKPVAQTSTASKSTAAPTDKEQVVQRTKSAYTAYIKVASSQVSTDFMTSSGYFTADFKSLPGGEYSPMLCDQDVIPQSVNVTAPVVNGASASVRVTKVLSKYSYPSFTVNLVKTGGKWLISSTDCSQYIKAITS